MFNAPETYWKRQRCATGASVIGYVKTYVFDWFVNEFCDIFTRFVEPGKKSINCWPGVASQLFPFFGSCSN